MTYLDSIDSIDTAALHNAIRRKNIEKVRYLLISMRSSHKEEDICKQSNTGNTALHYACIDLRVDIVRLLLQYMDEKTVGIQNNAGDTVLHRTVYHEKQNWIIINILLAKMSEEAIGIQNNKGNTVLHCIFEREYPDRTMVKMLLAKMSEEAIGIKNNKGNTALHCILEHKNPDLTIVNMLFAKMSDNQLFAHCLKKKSIIDFFLNHKFYWDIPFLTEDNLIRFLDKMSVNRILNKTCANSNNTLLHYVCFDKPKAVKFLLQKMPYEFRTFTNRYGKTALELAGTDEIRSLFNPKVKSACY